MTHNERFDVVVVGGGPAGSVCAWSLARQGVRVAIVERGRFPREKVCGDFVEPGGLRILDAMDCLSAVQAGRPQTITDITTYINSERVYRGPILYYEADKGLPAHGYMVARSEFDSHLLDCARAASANIYEGCSVAGVGRGNGRMQVAVRDAGREFTLDAALVVGADGAESTVARAFGLSSTDPRYSCVSQRAYVEGVSVPHGEALIWFDLDTFPGYAWLFPMADGRANVGVGVLSEACRRFDLSVPKLFRGFIEKLRRYHPGCESIRVDSRPLGGIVKSYAGSGQNYFDGGVLVGDAGCFADPITGEGITPGMESALIASDTLLDALQRGRFDRTQLAGYERDFRAHFDPSMRYLAWVASLMRNRHMKEFCLRTLRHAYDEAQHDDSFARTAGASFGGLELRPAAVISQVASKIAAHVASGGAGLMLGMVDRKRGYGSALADDLRALRRGVHDSMVYDPRWHMGWARDIMMSTARLEWTARNPRVRGHVIPPSNVLGHS